MEDIDRGLHPAVDGQSLDEDEDKDRLAAFRVGEVSWSRTGIPVQRAQGTGPYLQSVI